MQAFAAVAQHVLDLLALADLLVQAAVAGLQGGGAAGVLHGQGKGCDQQQADDQTGGKDDFRQRRGQLLHQSRARFELQGEALVVQQVQRYFLLRGIEGSALFATVNRSAGFQQVRAEVVAVEIGE
ncbi:hypothetical protein D9M68_762760 [compost metagenome]